MVQQAHMDHFPVVGIGASAGGLEAVSELLAELPAATGMAHVLVQHLDAAMPDMDGYEVLKRLRAQSAELQRGNLAVAALTGLGEPAQRERIRQPGFDADLVKPADPEAVYALLASVPAEK
jgi:CheY-like chemotaxis protein